MRSGLGLGLDLDLDPATLTPYPRSLAGMPTGPPAPKRQKTEGPEGAVPSTGLGGRGGQRVV